MQYFFLITSCFKKPIHVIKHMVKLDKIYTRGGDTGYIHGWRKKNKNHLFEAIGNVDELNAFWRLLLTIQT